MGIKLVSKENIIQMPKNTYSISEVLEAFLEKAPKSDSELQTEVKNAVIVYQTSTGFAHAVLKFEDVTHLIGALETAKTHLLIEYLSSGDIIYDDDDEDDD